MRVARRRRTVGRPARVRDADGAGRGIAAKFLDQIAELAFGAAADQLAALDRAHARRIIAAVLHALPPVDEAVRPLGRADDSANSANGTCISFTPLSESGSPAYGMGTS